MLHLALANLLHHRLRTLLSILAVGIGIALMLVSGGLADGSIAEVAQRMQSVDAELVVLPRQENVIFSGGAVFPGSFEKALRELRDENGSLAAAVIPAFFGQVKMGGQQQRLFGIHPDQMKLFLGPRKLVDGKLFDQAAGFEDRMVRRLAAATSGPAPAELSPDEFAGGLELVIDERLCRVGDRKLGRSYRVGDTIEIMGRAFRLTGVVEAGVAGRVFAPIQTLREMLNSGEPFSSMYFIKLRGGVDAAAVADRFEGAINGARVEPKSEYGRMLRDSFAQVNLYLNASSGLALVVCFLFILLTMYTMVVERTREIGILKSLGVTRGGLLRLSATEALIISLAGVLVGFALAWLAKFGLATFMPLLTVALEPGRLLSALAVGLIGGVLSALYPGWRAARLEPAAALSHE
ncbi:Macrolide export ATP-binding/permease protein MacB [Phycisphaerae bacterium RAS1]|nr:Macrolide export ATP-binding/permease protein MacB [Phycisphaerae bacterium RAS1]